MRNLREFLKEGGGGGSRGEEETEERGGREHKVGVRRRMGG